MLGVIPTLAVSIDICQRSFPKGLLRCLLGLETTCNSKTLSDRVDSLADLLFCSARFVPRFCERDLGKAAQAHVSAFAAHHRAQYPGTRS